MKRILLILFVALAVTPAWAVQPDEILKDHALEARARALSGQLRCLVCQNQSIDDSDATLARDLRLLIREHLTGGESDQQVMDFIVARYGDYVLLNPRLTGETLLLWGTPFAVLLVAGMALILRRRNTSDTPERPLSAAEQDVLKKALE